MADSYHINDNDQVVPYSGGKMNTSTDSWRDATELELTQRAEIAALEEQIEFYKSFVPFESMEV